MRIHFLFLLLLCSSCQNDPILIGHWHVEIKYPSNDGVPSASLFTFDVLNDTLLSVGGNPPFWGGQPGHHDEEVKTFHFGVECISTAWNYSIESKNKLLAFDLHSDHPKQITLTRNTGCTVESHLFLDSRLSISLPESIPGTVQLHRPAFQRNYTIGPAKEDYEALYPGIYRYQLGDKIITKKDTGFFELFELQHLVKLPERKRHLCKNVVYANAKTNSNALNALLEYAHGKESDTLYFAMLRRRPDTTTLHYLPIPVKYPMADKRLNIEEWLRLEVNNR